MQDLERFTATKKVTLLGGVLNIILAVVKLVVGVIGHSHALIADGIHSLSDLLSDILVLVAARYGGRAADHDHPYGHGRIETAATMFLALLLILAGAAIAFDTVEHLWRGVSSVRPDGLVLIIAAVSIITKEGLYHLTQSVARRIDSDLLLANAWHHRSDAVSSIVVLIGASAAFVGFTYLDLIAAFVVGGMIIKMGWELAWSSIRELIDTGVEPPLLNEIEQLIVNTPGVIAIHQLRSRSIAGKVLVDVHVLVEPMISVSEGHHIAQQVHYRLVNTVDIVHDVTVHIDPEDDEEYPPSLDLSSRDRLLSQLQHCWSSLPGSERIQSVILHYLGGQITVEVKLPLQVLTDLNAAKQLETDYQHAVAHIKEVDRLLVLYVIPENA